MKVLIILMLCLSCTTIWAENRDMNEIGRSLANYQACSQMSIEASDEKMFVYYQTMLNDIGMSVLSFDHNSAKQVYDTWDKSGNILSKISNKNLMKICLSRFDVLSRQMANKINH